MIKVAAIRDHGPTPWLMNPTAINCAEPAKTMSDMSTALKGEIPAAAASTPNAKPMGRYPNTTGSAGVRLPHPFLSVTEVVLIIQP